MFRWLFRKSNFYRFQDTLGLNSAVVRRSMSEALVERLGQNEIVFLIVHFPQTFQEIESVIGEMDVEYVIETEKIDLDAISRAANDHPNRVHVTMSQMLVDAPENVQRKSERMIAVVGAERHPLPKYDQQIETWCKSLPYPTQLGYFLSLEDPLLDFAIDSNVKTLLAQFGVGENELVTSQIVSKRLTTVLKRKAKNIDVEVPADSIEKWLELNYAETQDTSRNGNDRPNR